MKHLALNQMMRTVLFWVIMQQVAVISCRRSRI